MKVLELYSGIGGMHFALKCSGLKGEVKASIDINPVANYVYKHNFPDVPLFNRNIESLTSDFINSLDVDTILMSPPCQPFTRNGLKGDTEDGRTKSFLHILEILPELNVERILIENVKGFEESQMRNLLIETLKKCNFIYQEFLLSPMQIAVPNSRLRYYCLAKKSPNNFSFDVEEIKTELPPQAINESKSCHSIGDIVEESEDLSSYYLKDKVLQKYLNILDICFPDSRSSCCFTKSYGRYIEGTGSVFTDKSQDFVNDTFKRMSLIESTRRDVELAHELRLRFFTPKEISRLMSFPEAFSFPEDLKDKQKYMLLGNSINVRVVSELIKLLE